MVFSCQIELAQIEETRLKKPDILLVNVLFNDKTLRSRAVAFPVAKTKQGTTIFATCAHVVEGKGMVFPIALVYSDGASASLPTEEMYTNHVMHPNSGTDLAFIEAKVGRNMKLCTLSDSRIDRGTRLFHARNVCYKEGFDDDFCVVTEQTASAMSKQYVLIDGAYREVTKDLIQVLGRHPPAPQKVLMMRSWPGVSGSPVWDELGKVRGMVCGGNEELTADAPEHFMVYLPADKIKKNLKKFLGNRILK